MSLNIFTDLHHGDLYFSLHRLFVDRLGYNLYRPIGLDWFRQGYWKIAEPYGNAPDTINQYLGGEDPFAQWPDSLSALSDTSIKCNYVSDNIAHIYDPAHDYFQKAITFDKFKEMKIDVVISTISSHDRPYEQLVANFKPTAKLIAHLGNTGQRTHLKNVIHSVPYSKRAEQNAVLVHQELDSNLYSFVKPRGDSKNIYSVVNCYPYPKIYETYKSLLKEVNMKYYGGGSPDGSLMGAKGVAEKMKESNIGWHLKPQGGLGHSAMGWMYSGRPIITNMSQHRSWGGNAIKLFEPGVTCHDIEAHTVEENCKAIRRMLEPEENIKWCERAKQRFHEIIDYDKEEQDVRKFLENLL